MTDGEYDYEYGLDDEVIIHSLGDDHEYRAKIKGIASTYPEVTFYIIEMTDSFRVDYPYTHTVVPDSCIKRQ